MKHQESKEQQALIAWSDIYYDKKLKLTLKNFLFAIPNGGKRNVLEAARLKKEGVRAGVPDLFLALPSNKYHGLFIEMKSTFGRLTEHQKKYIKLLTDQNYKCVVCRSWVEAKDAILNYLEANK